MVTLRKRSEEFLGLVPTLVVWDVRSCPFPKEKEVFDYMLGIIDKATKRYLPSTFVDMIAFDVGPDVDYAMARHLAFYMQLLRDTEESHLDLMIRQLENWGKGHRNPASNYLVITGDEKGLSSTLKSLYDQGHNICVAHPGKDWTVYPGLVKYASYLWDIDSLVVGLPPYCVRHHLEPPCLWPERKVPTLVIWDAVSVPLPKTSWEIANLFHFMRDAVCNACNFANARFTALAYGIDRDRIHPDFARELVGIQLIPKNTESYLDFMMGTMKEWTNRAPAPANYLVISLNPALSSTLHDLQSRGYNILLAHPRDHPPPPDLVKSASFVWKFEYLIRSGSPYLVKPEMMHVPPTEEALLRQELEALKKQHQQESAALLDEIERLKAQLQMLPQSQPLSGSPEEVERFQSGEGSLKEEGTQVVPSAEPKAGKSENVGSAKNFDWAKNLGESLGNNLG